ncbi:hypothetical protein BU23DRAFT_484070 [Bimuria novae-zelandiae CBS 107.79]|uniref:DUF3405 domain-containing protein n=1 Tax=Bimuria novae-zelandiae CBS 107.79 TaxID=1447943 RepID=A0A6A5UU44_9PLEO|nr:hypothetical protein BU23DRAFT_484070 [Bimuria novae-zelandiae CBS 107.79]
MIVRSPSKSTLLLLVTAFLGVGVWHLGLTHSNVYQRLPFITPKLASLHSDDTIGGQGLSDLPPPTLFEAPTTAGEESDEVGESPHLELPEKGSEKHNFTTKPPLPPWEKTEKKGSRLDHEDMQHQDAKAYLEDMLDWNRPSWQGHWPPFADYEDKEYDPNRWEEFDYDERFYTAGLHRLSGKTTANPVPYRPFPEYNSDALKEEWEGEYVACDGPRGVPLNVSEDDQVRVYRGVPVSFPKVFAGGYDVVGLDGDVCFDRYSRYGPYGYGDDENPENVLHWKAPQTVPQWEDVVWGDLQDECLVRNEGRYRPGARAPTVKSRETEMPDVAAASAMGTNTAKEDIKEESADGKKFHSRTAVLIRAWTGYTYEQNDITAIRAMITELALASGGEYEVFLLVHVKDGSLPIFTNTTLYNEILAQNVPQELRSIALLWNEAIFPSWYPDIGDWQVYWHQFMCLQWFSLLHPHFDYLWNWETDARYTGHHYHFFDAVSRFAAQQPRKLLWERNKRFYMPSVHGSYAAFVEDTHSQVLNARAHGVIPPPVWGPRPWKDAVPSQEPLGPVPPTSFEEDRFEWGVHEPADLITLLPIWDPRATTWSYKDKIWNYIPAVRPVFTASDPAAESFTHDAFGELDRRVFINTVGRFSKGLLSAMHTENAAGRSMAAEMWPATVALQHGFKAVYAPHPIFADRYWPAPYAAAVFDTASIVDEETGGAREYVQGAWTEQGDSPYNHDREKNFEGWSWYFSSGFARRVYRRWLGWEVGVSVWGEGESVVRAEEGVGGERRVCVPGMLLHPVKKMRRERV